MFLQEQWGMFNREFTFLKKYYTLLIQKKGIVNFIRVQCYFVLLNIYIMSSKATHALICHIILVLTEVSMIDY